MAPMPRSLRYALIAVAAAVVLFVIGPWVYINFIRDDAPESFVDEATATTVTDSDPAAATTIVTTDAAVTAELDDPSGVWQVSADSQVGYRVDEVLFGQNVTAVGRTNAVTGSIEIAGGNVTAAKFEVDMTTVTSDEPKRDAQFASRIMDVLNFPTASFLLESPIALPADATSNSVSHSASGTLTLRGTSKVVDLTVVSSVRDGRIVVVGEIPVVFEEWGIPNPSIPGISTEDSGVLEFSLVLER